MISIVVPAYNEEKRIGKMLETYGKFFSEKKKEKEIKDFEILIVINNTKDRTEEIVKQFSKKYREIRHLDFKQGGKGFAITQGFKDALKRKNKFIGFIDADMSTPPESFYELIKTLEKNRRIGGVIANRWDKRSRISPKQNLFRRVISRGYNLVVRTLFLFPYADTQCGAKAFRREVLEGNMDKMISSQWNFDVALLFCLKKEARARIIDIPTVWEDKQASKVNLKRTPMLMLASLIRLRLIHSPFKFIVRFYRRLPARLKIH
jgi:glycosyltransferase involved in cell wall biosynthesis